MLELINLYLVEYGLVTLFLLMLTNGFLSAPPSELTIASAAAWYSYGGDYPVIIVLLAVAGNFVGTCILFFIGRSGKVNWIFKVNQKAKEGSLLKKITPSREMSKALLNSFEENAWFYVGVLRCLPAIRSIVSLPAGMSKLTFTLFTFYSLIGMTIWAILWTFIGVLFLNIYTTYASEISLVLMILASSILYVAYVNLKIYRDKLLTTIANEEE